MKPVEDKAPADPAAEDKDQRSEKARVMLEAQEEAARDRQNEGGYQ